MNSKMSNCFKASLAPPDLHTSQAWWFILSGYRLLVTDSERKKRIPLLKHPEQIGVAFIRSMFIGILAGIPCYAAEMDPGSHLPAGFVFEELRSLFSRLEDGVYEGALTAVHLIEWDKNSQFCSRCRAEMRTRADIRAKECPECGRLEFPRISPAIIVLIERGESLLLARSSRFPGKFFSVLAGFAEPGESLEEAVRREVMEETGIAVKDVKYFGSQPWPFPDSLMIGFTAQYESGEIRIDGEEIAEAGWYRADNLPQIPGKLSIARQLIDWFVAKHS